MRMQLNLRDDLHGFLYIRPALGWRTIELFSVYHRKICLSVSSMATHSLDKQLYAQQKWHAAISECELCVYLNY